MKVINKRRKMKQNKYTDLDYAAYDLYVKASDTKNILNLDIFVKLYNYNIAVEDIKLSNYYEKAKQELRKQKLKKLYEVY
jgi:hypothetical protein